MSACSASARSPATRSSCARASSADCRWSTAGTPTTRSSPSSTTITCTGPRATSPTCRPCWWSAFTTISPPTRSSPRSLTRSESSRCTAGSTRWLSCRQPCATTKRPSAGWTSVRRGWRQAAPRRQIADQSSTLTDTDPDFPPADAVMVTLPSRMPVTRPLLSTVARPVLELVQVNVTPGMTLLFASYAVAVNCSVWPSSTRGLDGVSTIFAIGGGVTETAAVPLADPEAAVMVTLPGATPVTTPLDETVATAGLLLDHEIGAPAMTLPLASRAVAVSVDDAPTAMLAVAGETVTLATGA